MITKKPYKENRHFKNIWFTKSARIGFKTILEKIGFKPKQKILLPAYIGITDREGSGVFDPINQLNLEYDFYAINNCFKIDTKEITDKIKTGEFKALLIIHYFGFLHCEIEEISRICRNNNIALIEDCAHSFNSFYKRKKLGNFGDYSFFSLHKFLSTPDGGYFKINSNKASHIEISIDEKISLETIEDYCKSDVEVISKTRTDNYKYFAAKIESISGLKLLFPKLPDGIVPMNLPVIVEKTSREQLYFDLINDQIATIALYYRLIPEISKQKYPHSYFLSANILNLPVHQNITKKDIDVIISKLNELLS